MVTEIGDAQISSISVDGNNVSFEAEIDMGGVMVPFTFKGSSGDSKLRGMVNLNLEGQEMAVKIDGTKE